MSLKSIPLELSKISPFHANIMLDFFSHSGTMTHSNRPAIYQLSY